MHTAHPHVTSSDFALYCFSCYERRNIPNYRSQCTVTVLDCVCFSVCVKIDTSFDQNIIRLMFYALTCVKSNSVFSSTIFCINKIGVFGCLKSKSNKFESFELITHSFSFSI